MDRKTEGRDLTDLRRGGNLAIRCAGDGETKESDKSLDGIGSEPLDNGSPVSDDLPAQIGRGRGAL